MDRHDELRPQVPQNIRVIVFDSDNNRLELSVAYDLTHEDWEYYLKTMMIFLGFGVARIEINPEDDDYPADSAEAEGGPND